MKSGKGIDMSDLQVILTVGAPASGKSTWAKEQVRTGVKWKRINKDDLREMLDCSEWSGANEKFILDVRDNLIMQSIASGYNVIVDDTNIHTKHEARIRALVKQKATVSLKVFHVPLQVCLERDKQRAKPVGAKVIKDMYRAMVARFGEVDSNGWNLTPAVEDLSLNPAFNPTKGKPAIICDLDGTLALLNGRNPYDASK